MSQGREYFVQQYAVLVVAPDMETRYESVAFVTTNLLYLPLLVKL